MKPFNFGDLVSKYSNKWIAMDDNFKVIAKGDSLREVLKIARNKGVFNPSTARIPDQKYSYVF